MQLYAGRTAALVGSVAMVAGLGWWGFSSLWDSGAPPPDRRAAGVVSTISPAVPAPPSARPGGKAGVRFDFDSGRLDGARSAALREEAADGGLITAVRRDTGWALSFPAPCAEHADACPKAILRTDRTGRLNPDTRPVRWGALVRMSPAEVSKGANVLQKGHSLTGTQFKLQIDGLAGRPSCVLAGPAHGVNVIYRARARQGVADGGWHRLDCERTGDRLRITVDGTPDGQAVVPSKLSIANDLPLCIGGKGVTANNDQFHGALDDVYVDIG